MENAFLIPGVILWLAVALLIGKFIRRVAVAGMGIKLGFLVVAFVYACGLLLLFAAITTS